MLRGWRSRPEAGKPGPSFSVRRRYIVAGSALLLIVLGVVLLRGQRAGSDYAALAGCPLGDRATDVCIFARTESGELTIGRRTIPITKTITLQGGIHEDEATGEQRFIEATAGGTLSVTPQPIPGGLRAVVAPALLPAALHERFERLLARGESAVTATTELVVTPARAIEVNTQNLVEAKGIGLALPVKVKLSSPFLGPSCDIGSTAHPVLISLTTGKTPSSSAHGSAAGKPGHAVFKDDYNLVTLSEDTLVSDSFLAPRVTGCGGTLSALIDPAVDAELGLPVAAGHNQTIMSGTIKTANASAMRKATGG
jgi:hypothetical protein